MSNSWEPRPVPTVTSETEPFWAGAAAGEFRLQRCGDCDRIYYYPRSHCPTCLCGDVEWVAASGRGEVYSYTVTAAAENWPDDLPLVSAYVELEEGPRVLTALVNCDPGAIEVGTDVSVTFVPTEQDEVAIPVFEPVD